MKYISADGYFTYNTLEELENNEVIGALYMNDESIPPLYGYPLRIIFPGYFGVRQSMDEDFVWIFWEITLTPQKTGDVRIRSRATADDGSVQPESDNDHSDGTNSWPTVIISVSEGV